jgi:hypothetical protein
VKAKQYFITTILFLIVVSMSLSGIIQDFSFNNDWIAKIGNEKITISDFNRIIDNYKNSPELSGKSYQEIKMIALKHLIRNIVGGRIVEKYGIKKLGIELSDKDIARMIRSTPQFQENGKFSKAKFDIFLTNNKIIESEYIKYIRSKIISDFVSSPALNFRISMKKEAGLVANHMSQVRTYDLYEIANPANKPISEEEIKTHYDANSFKFVKPGYLKISYITFEDIYNAIQYTPSKTEIEDAVNGGKKTIAQATKDLISYHKNNTINSIKRQIEQGSTMKDLANSFKINIKSANINQEDSSFVSMLKNEEKSGIMEFKKDNIVYNVDKYIKDESIKMDLARAQIIKSINEDRVSDNASDIIAEVKNDSKNLEKAIMSGKIKKLSTKSFKISDKNGDIEKSLSMHESLSNASNIYKINGKYHFGVLRSIKNNTSNDKEKIANIDKFMQNSMMRNISSAMYKKMMDDVKVELNEPILKSL